MDVTPLSGQLGLTNGKGSESYQFEATQEEFLGRGQPSFETWPRL